jgi:hypothetical protein
MPYQTLVLALLEQRPTLYHALRTRRTLLPTLRTYAQALKACHQHWIQTLAQTRPASDPVQRQSEALEHALADLQAALPPVSPEHAPLSEPFALDAAMAFLRRHTPPA